MIGKKGKWLFICIGLVITILVVSGSCLLAAEKPPIKVGLLLPYTGTMPFQTKGVNDSVELYFGELGMKAGGRPIQIIKEDDENNPTAGLTAEGKFYSGPGEQCRWSGHSGLCPQAERHLDKSCCKYAGADRA